MEFKKVTKTVQGVKEHAKTISHVVSIIRQIARTNKKLLSLNATIEAARAAKPVKDLQ